MTNCANVQLKNGFSPSFWLAKDRLDIVQSGAVVPVASGQTKPGWKVDVPTRLRWALVLVLLFHGSLLLFGTFRGTYDAYVHMFLGDHYARDWFSTWDQRWYTGFTTVSYPPGTHMTMAALSKVTGSLEIAFVITQVSVLLLLTVGVYRFSKIWVSDQAAANASLLLVCSSAIAETVHLYGQLPTTFALAFLLNSLPFIRRWVFEGRWTDLGVGTVVLAACTAGHHVTTLFGSVFFLGPVLVAGLLKQSRIARADEPVTAEQSKIKINRATVAALVARRVRRILPAVARGAILGPCILSALVIVVLPYWIWSGSDPIAQVPIPHGSRANFLADLNIGLIFFFIPWGLMLPLLPYALIRATVDRMWPIAASILLLFVLGTGGTTPVPKLLLGPAFDILTLDRFTFWAAIQILPLAGLFVVSIENGSIAAWLSRTGGPKLLRSAQVSLVVTLLATALFSATLARFRPFQPDPIDPDPIVAFIEKDQHERWRYLTLGFGDQMAWLSAQTTATQVDGNYHSVRRLPELTSTSVERLEGAKYRGISGLGSLQQFLEVPEKYHLKFVFANDKFYDPLLHSLGWQELGPLENGIVVWERGDIAPLPADLPVRELPVWQRTMWGVIPPAAIVTGLTLLGFMLARSPSRRPYQLGQGDNILFGPLGWIDRFLHRRCRLIEHELLERELLDRRFLETANQAESADDVSWGQRALALVRGRLSRPVTRKRKVLRLSTLAIVALMLPVRAVTAVTAPPTEQDAVEAYFDDLDFRRWESAYSRLDPATKPDYELWRLQMSVNGGLLASFAKLDSITTELVESDGDRATVRAKLNYLTAIDWYPVDRSVELVRREGAWYVVQEPTDVTVPPDQLARRAEVDYLIQGRRRVTSATSELTDIQDRPELHIRSAQLVSRDGLPVIVGEVANLDIDPADLTLTAVLRDAEGGIVAQYNATDYMMRTLVPRESTPFRIDFQEVAAGTDVDFDPLAFSPIELDSEIASAEVYAKAVVTQQGLFRGLQVNDAQIVQHQDGSWHVDGEIRNDGIVEATMPMVLISYLDEDGEVGWVDRKYVEVAIRPQRSGRFSVAIPDLDSVNAAEIETKAYHNGIAPPGGIADPLPPLLEIPDEVTTEYAGIRIDLVTMVPSP